MSIIYTTYIILYSTQKRTSVCTTGIDTEFACERFSTNAKCMRSVKVNDPLF